MIFVTVGTQAPFDRFIRAVDEIALQIEEPIIAQVYKNSYQPKNIQIVDFLDPDEFNNLFDKARLIVSHAGMGTIISALMKKKPIIIFPRLASLGEHRNEHQIATAMKINELGYAYVAYDAKQLEKWMFCVDLKILYELNGTASKSLIDSIAQFIRK